MKLDFPSSTVPEHLRDMPKYWYYRLLDDSLRLNGAQMARDFDINKDNVMDLFYEDPNEGEVFVMNRKVFPVRISPSFRGLEDEAVFERLDELNGYLDDSTVSGLSEEGKKADLGGDFIFGDSGIIFAKLDDGTVRARSPPDSIGSGGLTQKLQKFIDEGYMLIEPAGGRNYDDYTLLETSVALAKEQLRELSFVQLSLLPAGRIGHDDILSIYLHGDRYLIGYPLMTLSQEDLREEVKELLNEGFFIFNELFRMDDSLVKQLIEDRVVSIFTA